MTLQRKKEIGIIVVAALVTVLLLILFMLLLKGGVAEVASAWVWVVVLSLIWASLYLACTMFVTNRSGSSLLLAFIPALAIIAIGQFSVYAIGGGVIMLVLVLLLQRQLNWEFTSRVRIKTIPVFKSSARQLLLAILITCTALSLPAIKQSLLQGGAVVPSQLISQFLKPMDVIFQGFIPGYHSTSTIDDIIDSQVAQVAGQLPAGSGITVPTEQKMVARNELAQKFGLSLSGKETIADIISNVSNKYITQAVNTNAGATLLIIGISVILSFLILIPILIWPVLWLLQLWVFIAVRIGLIMIAKTTVEADRFTL